MLGEIAVGVLRFVQSLDVGDVQFEHFLDVEFEGVVRTGRFGVGIIGVVVELDVGGLEMVGIGGDQDVMVMVVVRSMMVGGWALFVLLRYDRSKEAGHVVDDAFRVQEQLIFGRTTVLDGLLADKA